MGGDGSAAGGQPTYWWAHFFLCLALRPHWSLALFGSDSAIRVGAKRRSRCRVTFENETRRKPLAGRDEYGGSNVFWYCSDSEPGSVYAGRQLDTAAVALESLIEDPVKQQLGGSPRRDYDKRHTAATARERTVSRGL